MGFHGRAVLVDVMCRLPCAFVHKLCFFQNFFFFFLQNLTRLNFDAFDDCLQYFLTYIRKINIYFIKHEPAVVG